jgi:hypothetical protein
MQGRLLATLDKDSGSALYKSKTGCTRHLQGEEMRGAATPITYRCFMAICWTSEKESRLKDVRRWPLSPWLVEQRHLFPALPKAFASFLFLHRFEVRISALVSSPERGIGSDKSQCYRLVHGVMWTQVYGASVTFFDGLQQLRRHWTALGRAIVFLGRKRPVPECLEGSPSNDAYHRPIQLESF